VYKLSFVDKAATWLLFSRWCRENLRPKLPCLRQSLETITQLKRQRTKKAEQIHPERSRRNQPGLYFNYLWYCFKFLL